MSLSIYFNAASTLRLTPLSCLLFLLLPSCTHRDRAADAGKAGQLYREGLKEAYDRNNPYCPEAELAFADSMLRVTMGPERTILITQFIRGFALLKIGEEKEAISA